VRGGEGNWEIGMGREEALGTGNKGIVPFGNSSSSTWQWFQVYLVTGFFFNITCSNGKRSRFSIQLYCKKS